MYTILHNPRCSKSRQTLALLKENGTDPEVVLYLENPPTKTRLKEIGKLLGKPPIAFTRTNEHAFKEVGLTKESSDNDILNAMVAHPILIERPIVIKNNTHAVIGRPPEQALDIH